MSVHLVGGGRELALASLVYGDFVAEASSRAAAAGRTTPRIGVVVVAEQENLADGVTWFAGALARCGPVEVLAATATEVGDEVLRLADGAPAAASWFAGLDGLLVGGGLTPAYHRVLRPHAADVRAAVRDGMPYAGFSAGAMLAATRALLGGWRLGTVPVTHEDNAEDLDEITVDEGLGLVRGSVEVHTAQWGTLSRLVAAVDAGATGAGIAIDENTVVILAAATDSPGSGQGQGARAAEASPTAADVRVLGAGQVWFVDGADDRVLVRRRPAD